LRIFFGNDREEVSGYTNLNDDKFLNLYDTCPESKDTKVLNMYNIFNLQKRHCE